jgi:hypothetical protein
MPARLREYPNLSMSELELLKTKRILGFLWKSGVLSVLDGGFSGIA